MRHAAAAYAGERALTPGERWVSLLETLLGAFIVIGHNVFRILPNEVPILFVLLFVSLRLRDGRWTVSGLQRPRSWPKTLAIAVIAAAVLQIGSELVIQPLGSHLWHRPEQLCGIDIIGSQLEVSLAKSGNCLEFCSIRRGVELPRLSSYACCRSRRSFKDRLRRGNVICRCPVRFRAFL